MPPIIGTADHGYIEAKKVEKHWSTDAERRKGNAIRRMSKIKMLVKSKIKKSS